MWHQNKERSVWPRLEFLNHNQKKFDGDEKDDLNGIIAQRKLYPNIPAEFLGVPLESEHHLPIPAEEEKIIDENATSVTAATNAEVSNEALPDATGISRYYSMPDLVEVDYNSDAEDDDDNNDGNVLTGVPVSNRPSASTARNMPPESNIPSANTPRTRLVLAISRVLVMCRECPYQFQRLVKLQLRGPILVRHAYQFLIQSLEEHMLTLS